MYYRTQAPSAALRPHVEAYWTIEAPGGAPAHRVLPDGCIDLLFDGSGTALLIGPMTRALVAPPVPPGARVFGVRFHPGEAAPFFGVAAREIRDGALPLDEVWGRLGPGLEDAVASSRSDEARIAAVERVLLARLSSLGAARKGDDPGPRIRAAVGALRASSGALSVDALAGRIGAGARTLERAFDERVGLGPKLLARIVRLQSLVAALDRAPAPSWSALAADLSFADQAHLVREVGKLAGATPGDLLGERRAVSELFNPGAGAAVTVPPSPALPARRKEDPR